MSAYLATLADPAERAFAEAYAYHLTRRSPTPVRGSISVRRMIEIQLDVLMHLAS